MPTALSNKKVLCARTARLRVSCKVWKQSDVDLFARWRCAHTVRRIAIILVLVCRIIIGIRRALSAQNQTMCTQESSECVSTHLWFIKCHSFAYLNFFRASHTHTIRQAKKKTRYDLDLDHSKGNTVPFADFTARYTNSIVSFCERKYLLFILFCSPERDQ